MEGSEDIVISIFFVSAIIVLVLVVLVVAFLLAYQYRMGKAQAKIQNMELDFQKGLLLAALDSQEKERQRIAKDLHDGVGAMLSTLRLYLSKIDADPKKTDKGLLKQDCFGMIDETIATVRQISNDLVPPHLSKLGLGAALSKAMEQVRSSGEMKVHFSVSDNWPRLPMEIELGLFRIGTELIHNSIKHSKAENIRMQLEWRSEGGLFQFQDDGVGIPAVLLEQRNAKGMGLRNIESRANLLGLSLAWKTASSKGMGLNLTIPSQKRIEASSKFINS